MDITPRNVAGYVSAMCAGKLAPYTIRQRIQFANTLFPVSRSISGDFRKPFHWCDSRSQSEGSNGLHIARGHSQDLEERSTDWRLIFTLSRYGGFRCPSEVLSLRRQDIDCESGEVHVTAAKTERYAGQGTRRIPLFPELRAALSDAFDQAPDRTVDVVDEKYRKRAHGPAEWKACNL